MNYWVNIKKGNTMDNNYLALIEATRQLKRVADALEESNKMIKELK